MDIDVSELNTLALQLPASAGAVGAASAAAIKKTALAIERDAKIFAPVDTGALRSSISTSFTGDGRYGAVEAEIGPTVDYAAYVEYGTSVHAPQAYMGPAFDRHAGELVAVLEQLAGGVL